MALSRWHHSDHYIYLVDDDVVQVCLFGHYTSSEILSNYAKIERKAKAEGYSLYSRWELKQYLTSWANFRRKFISYKQHSKEINRLRLIGLTLSYIRDPYSTEIRYITNKLFGKS